MLEGVLVLVVCDDVEAQTTEESLALLARFLCLHGTTTGCLAARVFLDILVRLFDTSFFMSGGRLVGLVFVLTSHSVEFLTGVALHLALISSIFAWKIIVDVS